MSLLQNYFFQNILKKAVIYLGWKAKYALFLLL